MSDPQQVQATFRRYAQLIEGYLAGAGAGANLTSFTRENATAVQVERGSVLSWALIDSGADESAAVDRLIELVRVPRAADVAVIDAAGHHRPVYRPLLIYAWLVAFRVRYETLAPDRFGRWDEALRFWSDVLEARLGEIVPAEAGIAASGGDAAAEAAWTAAALHVAGKVFIRDAWTDLAADTFGRLCRAQRDTGAFLTVGPSDNPEPVWYHELTILHAAASYAVQSENRAVARAVARSTAFAQKEIQPDHATSQPWGVFAFIWNDSTRPMADQLLHAATLRQPLDGVSLILLADALYCLRLFL